MNRYLFPLLGFALAVAGHPVCAQQADEPLESAIVLVSDASLGAETRIEAAFPRAMVPAAALGKPATFDLVKSTPAWKGQWVWESERVARFVPAEAPKIGTRYEFVVRSGLKDAAGGKVPVDKASATEPTGLEMAEASPAAGPAGEEPAEPDDESALQEQDVRRIAASRGRSVIALFNAPVDEASLKNRIAFADKDGQTVPGVGRLARWSEIPEMARRFLPWGDQVVTGKEKWGYEEVPELPPQKPVGWAVLVSPAQPLPAGVEWAAVLSAGIAAADSKVKLAEAARIPWGTILPGAVTKIETYCPVDEENVLQIQFDKPPTRDVATLLRYLKVTPPIQGQPKVEVRHRLVEITSPSFAFQRDYEIAVQAGLPMADGLPLPVGRTEKTSFQPHRASVGLPSTGEVQLAQGHGVYPVKYVNVSSLRLRAKAVAAADAAKVNRAYQTYVDGLGEQDAMRGYPLTFDLVPGETVLDQTVETPKDKPVNRSGTHELKWGEVLGDAKTAGLFFEVTGVSSLPGSPKPVALSQAFVQITDLGLAWKRGGGQVLVFAFSHRTGTPCAEVDLTLSTPDGRSVANGRTDANGLARLTVPEKPGAAFLLAAKGGDYHVTAADDEAWSYTPWQLGSTNFAYGDLPKDHYAACLVTDRDLYRPGEAVQFAALVRGYQGQLPVKYEGGKVKVVCYDGDDRVFFEEEAVPDASGVVATEIPLPPVKVGFFHVQVEIPTPAAERAGEGEGEGGDALHVRVFPRYFQVQEFRRNTFEIECPMPTEAVALARVETSATARYYLGAPVADGKVQWTAHFSGTGFYPEQWRDFLFADHREFDGGYWSHYFGLDYYFSPSRGRGFVQGQAVLDPGGAAPLAIDVPEEKEFPVTRTAYVTVEVTDPKDQTLSSHHEITIHPAEFYLGLQRPPDLVREGDTLTLQALAVKPDGALHPADFPATLRIEKQVWTTVEVKQAGGGMVKRNESHLEQVAETTIQFQAGKATVDAALPTTGTHHLTLEATDPAGHPVRTTVAVTVQGKDYYAWEGLAGVRIDLLPDKKLYQPGETARILVKTPLQGTALVTVEREGVERAFVTKLEGPAPVVEVALTDLDAPNTQVGVMVLEGTETSRLKYPVPRAKFGYAILRVERRLSKLAVTVEPARPSVRPGTDTSLLVKVKDHAGQPVANTALVVYAVDEGVLTVAGYETPDPLEAFHPERPLRVRTSATFGNILSEDPAELDSWNKGYLVGGGGEAEGQGLRADFRPTAFWSAKLRTDARGEATVVLRTPDTLTRYRLLAVAAAPDFWRFGLGVGQLEVNKPVMVDPSAPRFAHVGDLQAVRALVVNRTERTGTFTVSLKADSLATLESAPRLDVDLGPGESKPVEFLVRYNQPGTTTWRWQAEPVKLDPAPGPDELPGFADAVQSSFEVVHPVPVLRERVSLPIAAGPDGRPLLDPISPILRAGTGRVLLTVANTRLLEGLGAMGHLLHYPYGCAEQVSSAVVPWLAAHRLREMVPDAPPPEEIRKVVATAVARLASMQTESGALGYWPEAEEGDLWASAHAAHVLVLARKEGFDVPASLLDPLLKSLADSVPGFAEEKDVWRQADRARALYVLAMAGQPDAGTMNRLFDDRARLTVDGRLYLALAMATAGQPEPARELLAMPENERDLSVRWYPSAQRIALRLQATIAAGLPRAAADAVLDDLVKRRGPEGHWDSTFSNAWSLLALGTYHDTFEKEFSPARVVVAWEGQTREFALDPKPMQSSVTVDLRDLPPAARPMVRLIDGKGPLFVSAEVTSRPPEMPRKRSSAVFSIERQYRLVQPDGTLAAAESFKVGDMVAVTLTLKATEARRYLAIDDPLPSTFEAINPEFESQAGSQAAMANVETWESDHSELRDDRALFFCNALSNPGTFELTYLARVTKAGTVFAPPVKVEAMYDPSLTALGEGRTVRSEAR